MEPYDDRIRDAIATMQATRERIADLQRQLAEAKAEIEILAAEKKQRDVVIDDCRRQLKEQEAEIEAMRPVVDAARYHERSVTFYSHGTSSDPYHCDVCRAYKVYEARKQP